MITRVIKRENPFVQIDKRPLGDMRLSWRAKGILAYLLSKPDDWTVQTGDILNHGTEGRDAVRAAMIELRDTGYAKLENTRDGREWHIFENPEPCPEKPSMADEPCPEKANIGKSATTNNKEERNNKEVATATPFKLEQETVKNGQKRNADSLFTDLLPDSWLNSQPIGIAWRGFVEMRRAIKKPLTDRAVTILMNKVITIALDDQRIARREESIENITAAILDQSTTHNWQGVFAVKPGDQTASPAQAAKKEEEPERYAEFIRKYPDQKFASKFARWSDSDDPSLSGIRMQFRRWLRTGHYDGQAPLP